MTTNPKARKFRIRRTSRPATEKAPSASDQVAGTEQPNPQSSSSTAPSQQTPSDRETAAQQLDAIRQEGLTGRQLRMARRIAQKYGIPATSDFDAVRQLRARGINPFEKANLLDIVSEQNAEADNDAQIQLPRTVQQPGREVALHDPRLAAEQRASEICRVQQDIARRRKRRLFGLFARLTAFVFLPTIAAGYYFYVYATPMYATNTEFVIQQAEPAAGGAAGGLGGLFQGTSMATQQDSITVQSYLGSRAAMPGG